MKEFSIIRMRYNSNKQFIEYKNGIKELYIFIKGKLIMKRWYNPETNEWHNKIVI